MNFKSITPNKDISLFVKDILIFESSDAAVKTCLPFFADGYPGLIFQQTTSGLIVNPHQKLMPTLFLYGQTLKPIELEMNGTYRIIVFQLYPFLLKGFFNITPDSINDNCYDLGEVKEFDIGTLLATLLSFADTSQRVECLSHFLLQLFILKKQNLDYKILQVIKSIIKEKGTENIINITKSHHINSRTLERRFFAETGLSPKQFAKVIQFQSSLEQLNYKDFTKLTDIVYGNGFSDQSHFIKVFKAYTGKTPNAFIRQ